MRTLLHSVLVLAAIAAIEPRAVATRVGLRDGRWMLNDQPTNPDSAAEGLLMNVRMVNATFEDRGRTDFDAEANTDRFISQIGDYAAHGVNAFTLCLQGGMPGYEGALNSTFEPDGSLRPAYLARVERVIRACDRHGVVVILGLFYQRQSAILKDEQAVRAGVRNAVRWVRERGFQNVLIEIANEYPHKGFVHPVIRDPIGMASLIRLAKQTAPGLLVTASGYGDGKIHAEVAEACDFLTPHWNGTKVENIPARLAELRRFGKPIVCNEDDKTGAKAVAAMQASIAHGAGYGLMLKKHNQTFPFHFDGAADDPLYYAALKAATSARQSLQFQHHYLDRALPGSSWGQTAIADVDRDGKLDFITGRSRGEILWYRQETLQRWTRHTLGEHSASDVGGAALDVDGDGWLDFVTGGAWYRNTGKPRDELFERIVLDPELANVHDLVVADIDGDGRPDILTMSDKNNLRWYRIPKDPRQPWQRHDIGPSVHAGIGVGDIDGDGDLDVVRSNLWFENADGKGTRWIVHENIPFGNPNKPYPLATHCVVLDMDRDGDKTIW